MTPKPSEPGRLVSIDPHDGKPVGEVLISSPGEARAAVERAGLAQPSWAATPYEERAAALARALPLLEEAEEELASLVHREMGKPMPEALAEARGTRTRIARSREAARKAVSHDIYREGDLETTVRRDPLGVVAVITPWNFPLAMPASLIYPAVLTGNTVVHKPSEKTPLTGRRFTEIVASALPAGVLEHLPGDESTGRALVESDVRMVAFVGSQAAGRDIMARCAGDLKRIVLEMGGKDPMIVLADADIDRAAGHAAEGAFLNAGQVCCAVERVYVERPVADAFLERVAALAGEMEIGPLVDGAQRDHVCALVEDAVAKGARVLAGGVPGPGPGYSFPPTVLTGLRGDMALAREEIFGPVLCVHVVDGPEEALEGANETEFGLGASVWTADRERGEEIAARIQAGMVGINRGLGAVGDAPWVGARQSGFGYMGSVDGIRHFTQVRTITRSVEG